MNEVQVTNAAMEFLNKPMSEVWKATKKSFNDFMEISHSDLTAAEVETSSRQGSQEFSNSEPTTSTPPPPSENSTRMKYRNSGKTSSLPRLIQRGSKRRDSDGFYIVNSRELDGNDDVYVGGRSRTTSSVMSASDVYDIVDDRSSRRFSDSGGSGQYVPRNRYRSNSSDRASMRNRNEAAMVNSSNRYHR